MEVLGLQDHPLWKQRVKAFKAWYKPSWGKKTWTWVKPTQENQQEWRGGSSKRAYSAPARGLRRTRRSPSRLRDRGFSKLTRFRNTENSVNPLFWTWTWFKTLQSEVLRVFLNLWLVCGSPFTKTMEITKMTKTMKTIQTATNKELSAGFAEITETGAEKKWTLQKHPFGRPSPRTTPSLWFFIVSEVVSYLVKLFLKSRLKGFLGTPSPLLWRAPSPEVCFSPVIIAFGAFRFIVPKYYYRLGKMEFKEP